MSIIVRLYLKPLCPADIPACRQAGPLDRGETQKIWWGGRTGGVNIWNV